MKFCNKISILIGLLGAVFLAFYNVNTYVLEIKIESKYLINANQMSIFVGSFSKSNSLAWNYEQIDEDIYVLKFVSNSKQKLEQTRGELNSLDLAFPKYNNQKPLCNYENTQRCLIYDYVNKAIENLIQDIKVLNQMKIIGISIIEPKKDPIKIASSLTAFLLFMLLLCYSLSDFKFQRD